MARYVLVIEKWHPYTSNQLMSCHHQQRARLKRIDRHLVMAYCALHRFPVAVGLRRVELTIIRGEGDKGRPVDPDNWWKSLLDALVWAKMLIDDGEAYCEHKFIATEHGPQRATRITLIDL
jgi:hypothetical protein